jgi:predicted Fe-S protein YdhL (DUF1289 family)
MNIQSPCRHVCQLDAGDMCAGCFRTRDEIARWLSMTDDERARIMALLTERAGELEVAHE